MPELLKLAAEDAEDMQVISACLQDAVGRVGDTVYLPNKRRFAALFNRFRWENEARHEGRFSIRRQRQRVRCGLHFDGVLAVRMRGVSQENEEQLLDLLAIECSETRDAAAEIKLLFAGGPEILLEVECIDCHLEDVSIPWRTGARPDHPLDD